MNQQAFMLDLAGHLDSIAGSIRRYFGPVESPPASQSERATLMGGDVVSRARELHPPLGSHQEMVLRKLAAAHPDGLSASEINPNADTLPNTYTTLEKLEELGMVRRVEGRPRRYYLDPIFHSAAR